MVGIVIVCHSERLAEGVKELAGQMTQDKVPIEAAGGIDDPDNPIGTDPMKVLAAIEAVHAAADSGVLVLMDLGSALMSAETALDFLSDEVKATVRLCAAPLVEGALAAAVQASAGASLGAVAAEALAALAAKKEQLVPITGDSFLAAATAAAKETDADAVETRLVIRNPIGLHARPAANFVTTAAKFQSVITVFKGPKTANAKSINQLATLAARSDDEIRVRAEGPDAKDAIAAIEALNADNFGEMDEEIPKFPAPAVPASAAVKDDPVCGIPASAGVALGPAHLYRPALPKIKTRSVDDPEAEINRLSAALNAAHKEIEALAAKTKRTAGPGKATIFDVHRLLLDDPDLVEQAKKAIRKERINSEAAWLQIMETTVATYRSLANAYMQGRAADVIDAGNRVLRHLSGAPPTSLFLDAPALILAHDLLPSDMVRLDPEKVLGLVTVVGGSTSHAAIPVGMCGELAGNPKAAPLLIGLGVDELSMNATSISEVKAATRKLSAAECRNLVVKAQDQIDGDGVRQLLMTAGNRSA